MNQIISTVIILSYVYAIGLTSGTLEFIIEVNTEGMSKIKTFMVHALKMIVVLALSFAWPCTLTFWAIRKIHSIIKRKRSK